ncbi:MAG TPA: Holliday junction resolvase RuvX [Chloroflexi bacterium]|nr:Holliday junction resolvase RuvX [Chloroflexota bacterium]
MGESRRLMGIDHGKARIGIALSDPLGLFATPHRILTRRTPEEDFAELQAIIEEAGVVKIVIGLPTDSKGGIGEQARAVIHWARELAQVVEQPIVFWDESYSSLDAQAIRRRRGRRGRRQRREPLDDIAAAAILQDYLDSGGATHEPGKPLETLAHIA